MDNDANDGFSSWRRWVASNEVRQWRLIKRKKTSCSLLANFLFSRPRKNHFDGIINSSYHHLTVALRPLRLLSTTYRTVGVQLKCISSSGVKVYSNLFQPGHERFQSGIGETPSVAVLAMERTAEAGTTVGSRAMWPKRPRHLCWTVSLISSRLLQHETVLLLMKLFHLMLRMWRRMLATLPIRSLSTPLFQNRTKKLAWYKLSTVGIWSQGLGFVATRHWNIPPLHQLSYRYDEHVLRRSWNHWHTLSQDRLTPSRLPLLGAPMKTSSASGPAPRFCTLASDHETWRPNLADSCSIVLEHW